MWSVCSRRSEVRSAFPEGTIERVQVLTYGDDPAVEPGETAIRVFIIRAGRPEGEEADKEIVKAFEGNQPPGPQAIAQRSALHRMDRFPPSRAGRIGEVWRPLRNWAHLQDQSPGERAMPAR
jgi:hypothetical protein